MKNGGHVKVYGAERIFGQLGRVIARQAGGILEESNGC